MLNEFLKEVSEQVEAAMGRWIPLEQVAYINQLFESMRYSVFSGGKRLRPALVLMVGEALGLERQQLLPAACAIEMIHTYSLIHDDLPAMDDDDLRRGQPTNHKVFGEAIAILAGDALLTLAFQVLAESPLPDRAVIAMIRDLAIAAGPLGMVGGQVADMLETGNMIEEERVKFIHQHKTGALIKAAICMPAYAAQVDDETMSRLTSYGESIGLAFQIMDDVLDVVGDTDIIGKVAGMDALQEKATYPALYGVEVSKQMVNQLTAAAVHAVNDAKNLNQSKTLLIDLAYYLRDRDH